MGSGKILVMVFGVYDGCDEGHQYFLCEAQKLGSELVVAVARDEVAEKLKGKCAVHSTNERIDAIKALGIASVVVAGDTEQYSWDVLRTYKPNIIALGYDQQALGDALEMDRGRFLFSFIIEHIKKWEE